MIQFREWVSVIIFFAGLLGIYSLFEDVFEWSTLLITVFCFILAYIIWPSKRKAQRADDSWLADIFEYLIELPFDLLSLIFRLLGRILGGKSDGIDVDI